jgi:hypothetical protein
MFGFLASGNVLGLHPDLTVLGILLGTGFLIASLIAQASYYHGQAFCIEKMLCTIEHREIYRREANDLLEEFKLYLADMYPSIEKNIFSTMKPENVQAYMIKYPELKSSETICKLVDLINSKKGYIYKEDRDLAELKMSYRERERTNKIWVLPLLPKTDLTEIK